MPQEKSFIRALRYRAAGVGLAITGLFIALSMNTSQEDDLHLNNLVSRLSVSRSADCAVREQNALKASARLSQLDIRKAALDVLSSSSPSVWADAERALSNGFGLCAGSKTALDKENGVLFISKDIADNAAALTVPLEVGLAWAAAQKESFGPDHVMAGSYSEKEWATRKTILRYQ
ncbi:MAG: hypothetical protein H6868_03240 [Rhodospirillales bacterium]|nr:hypothetical protein [Rhodospirillales bacterium]